MKFETPKQYFDQIAKFVEENKNTLVNLKYRWLNEKEYEDFAEYKKVIVSRLAEYDLKVSSISRSFTLKFLYKNIYLIEVKVPLNHYIEIHMKPIK